MCACSSCINNSYYLEEFVFKIEMLWSNAKFRVKPYLNLYMQGLFYTHVIFDMHMRASSRVTYFVTFCKPTINIGYVNAISHYRQPHVIHDSICNVWSFFINTAHIYWIRLICVLSNAISSFISNSNSTKFFSSSIYTQKVLIFLHVIKHVSWDLLEHAA